MILAQIVAFAALTFVTFIAFDQLMKKFDIGMLVCTIILVGVDIYFGLQVLEVLLA